MAETNQPRAREHGGPESLVAVVTGGTKGIGLGLAEYLVQRGASVAVTYRSDRQAASRAEELLTQGLHPGRRLLILTGDAGDPQAVSSQVRQIHRELGPVAILINNAGIMPRQAFEDLSDQEWDETIRINLHSVFYWSSRVIPDMKKLGWGRIINMSSIAGRGGGVVGPHYAASKAAIIGLTRYAARELGQFGITVNAIAPAFIEDAGIFTDWSEQNKQKLKDQVMVPRLGRVTDVTAAVAYLLNAPFVTGATLDVNGGAYMV